MTYEYFNPNPKARVRKDGTPMKWHKGDCTTRALSKALDIEWKEAFKIQCEKAMELCDESDAKDVYEAILAENGFVKGVISKEYIKHNHCRPTVKKLVDDLYQNKGNVKVVINCTHHLVTAVGNVLYDTWDTSDEVVWGFWYKK